jgi:hypothetical protein
MVSSNKAGFDLRENLPLPRNMLHTHELGSMGSRGSERIGRYVYFQPITEAVWSVFTSLKVLADNLNYSADVRDTAKSGIGHIDNRHLNDLVESTSMNVGGSCRNVKASSLPMIGMSVGGVIVVGARESRVHGEGHQFVGIPAQNNQMVTWRNLL